MVEHASEYAWSNYQSNAVGKSIKLITPHNLYVKLGETPSQRQARYSALFDGHMPSDTLMKSAALLIKHGRWVMYALSNN